MITTRHNTASAIITGPLFRTRRNGDCAPDAAGAGAASTALAEFDIRGFSVSDTGVKHGIECVDNQIDEYVDKGEQQDQRLNHRVVAAKHGFDHQPPESGQVEYRLGHHDATDQQRNPDPNDGDDGNRRVTQGMPQQYAALAQ